LSTQLYEGMFLLDSNLVSKDWASLEKHILDLLKRHGAETLYSERWPERRLAYEVKGCKKGTYFLTYFNASGTAIPELHRDIELSERILRAMFINEQGLDEEMEKRKNKEIEIPPADLSFGDDRPSFGSRGRFRRREDSGPRERSSDERAGGSGAAAKSDAASSAPAAESGAVASEAGGETGADASES